MTKAAFLRLMREALARLDVTHEADAADRFTDWELLLGSAALDLALEQGLITDNEGEDEDEGEDEEGQG
jgi:hypothetical protein